ncbi:hypothetical protein [Streptomyces anulatus]|uniref:hypothetical protein n=1 Tax=Streptomyces anulatus TaxID=1892 RepID=UPI0036C74C2A
MEYAKLVAEYLKILIWPGVALTFILLFRAKISSAIGRLNSVDVAGMQASFAEGAEEARQETEELTLTAAEGEQNTPPEQAPSDEAERPSVLSPVPVPHPAFRRARDRAHRDPAEAVDMAWGIMEDALITALQARGVRLDQLVGARDSFINHYLAVAGMTVEARMTWSNLRTLHRTSAHAPDAPTLQAAIAYVESCRSFTVVALEALASAPLPQG